MRHFYSAFRQERETHRSECGEDDAGEEEDETAAAADTTATALPAAAAEEEDVDEEDDDAAATRSDRMWIHDEDGGEDAAVGEDDDDGEDEVLDRRSAFMSLSPTYPRNAPTHPTAARHYRHHSAVPLLPAAIPRHRRISPPASAPPARCVATVLSDLVFSL
jgi:hypothetical protein